MGSAETTMLMTVLMLPAAIGIIEALWSGRGVFGWLLSVIIAMLGGLALMLALVNFVPQDTDVPYAPGNVEAGVLIFGGLVLGAMMLLWIVNRVRP